MQKKKPNRRNYTQVKVSFIVPKVAGKEFARDLIDYAYEIASSYLVYAWVGEIPKGIWKEFCDYYEEYLEEER